MNKKNKIIIILTATLLLGGFLRFYQLGSQPYWMDEGYTINAVISGAQNGYSGGSSILDSGGKYFCPLYCFPTQIISQVAGQNAFSYRLLAAFFGIIFILLAFFITKIVFKNNKAALLAAFLVSFSYWQIAWSRQARWYTMLEVFFWLALLFFYLFLVSFQKKPEISLAVEDNTTGSRVNARDDTGWNKKYLYLALSIIFTILAITTHSLAYLLPLIMIIWYAIFNFEQIKKLGRFFSLGRWSRFIIQIANRTENSSPINASKYLKAAFFKILLPIIAAAAVILFAEYGLGLHFVAKAIKNVSLHYTLPYYLSFYLRNYWLLLEVAIYGFFAVSKDTRKLMTMIGVPFLIYLIFLAFFTDIVHYRYLFHTTLAIYILASVVIVDIFEQLSRWIKQLSSAQINNKLRVATPFAVIVIFIAIFFVSGEGVIFPKNFYLLESDDPSQFNRPYYAYTPQPDFNAAYAAIKNNLKPGEIVISSHPHFNKIFLNQPGYWLKYDYLGMDDTPNTITDNKEYYVGAETIGTLRELQRLVAGKHGYIVFDYMSTDGRISPLIINYIRSSFKLFFYNKINSYSQIWVYRF